MEQIADACAPLPHEAAIHCGDRHDAHVAALGLVVWRRSAAAALRTLRHRDMSNATIRELLASLREDVGVQAMVDSWPTAHAQAICVKDAARHAHELRESLRALPRATRQRLWLEISRQMADPLQAAEALIGLDDILLVLSYVGNDAARVLPPQDRHSARIGIVARVHRIAPQVAMSAAAGSVFHGLCTAAFALTGVTADTPVRAWLGNRHPRPTDPTGAIRAYTERSGGTTGK